MGKLVVLKLGEGSFALGFPVTLQIGEDGDRPSTEITGKLPPAPEIFQYYHCWQLAYHRLGLPYRLEAEAVQVTNVSIVEDCTQAVQLLRHSLNAWLYSESFRAIREKVLENLRPADEIRVLLQTEDIGVQRLPWHLCDLFERYPKAEIALSASVYESVRQASSPSTKVKILAILGNSAGIDTQVDRALLEQLPQAKISFLVEPQRQELTNQLWGQGWDILFFAGHSASQANGETGKIYINQTDSLTIDDLKYALQTSVKRGLKLAIFNSCDGLGLARKLASLQIPQVVVMREPIPDRVAHEFLKYFLKAFAGGKSFYLAVREARERLQGLEDEFPCATWLPVICQNPAEVPPTWQSLRVKVDGNSIAARLKEQKKRLLPSINSLLSVGLASAIAAVLALGMRHMGMIQALELNAFDQMTRLRPDEKPDRRILVISITDNDFQLAEQKSRTGSLSDLALARLLDKLEAYQPRAIGLDIYRDRPVNANQPDLATRLQNHRGFFAICKVRDRETNHPGISPPPEVPIDRQGFSDVVKDRDGILRRHLIAMKPGPTSPCNASYSLSSQLAFHYLEAEGIWANYTRSGLQLGKVVIPRLQPHTGGYQKVDAGGYQTFLNYRSYRSPLEVAPTVTLTDVLTGALKPDEVKDKIVLIGVTAQSAHDYIRTPYSIGGEYYQEMPGVIFQAQMVSQILSAVLDGRSLLWVWPGWGEVLWVWGWSIVGGVLAAKWRSPIHLALSGGTALGILSLVCFGFFIQGCWIPLVPSALALLIAGSSVSVYLTSQHQQQQISIRLSHD